MAKRYFINPTHEGDDHKTSNSKPSHNAAHGHTHSRPISEPAHASNHKAIDPKHASYTPTGCTELQTTHPHEPKVAASPVHTDRKHLSDPPPPAHPLVPHRTHTHTAAETCKQPTGNAHDLKPKGNPNNQCVTSSAPRETSHAQKHKPTDSYKHPRPLEHQHTPTHESPTHCVQDN